VPASIKGMADRAAQFIAAMGLLDVDLLGFSMGGYVAQIVTLDYLHLVRKLVLAPGASGRSRNRCERAAALRAFLLAPPSSFHEAEKAKSPPAEASGLFSFLPSASQAARTV